MAQDGPTKLYAQFGGDEIDGKVYDHGEALKDNVNAGTRQYLVDIGRFTSTEPTKTFGAPLVASDKAVGDMTRDELISTLLAKGAERLNSVSEDELRDLVERDRSREADEGDDGNDALTGGEGSGGGTSGDGGAENPEYEALKDKPLGQLKTAELIVIAEAEEVDLADADTNPKRVAAIQTKRDATAF